MSQTIYGINTLQAALQEEPERIHKLYVIEIHTGHFADAVSPAQLQDEFRKIEEAVRLGDELGLQVNAGHGLHYHNVQAVAALPAVRELNIGHAIIARALFSGLAGAVREMKRLMLASRA